MNRREVGEGFRAPRRTSNCFKDRDEELSFFRDLKKREKVQFVSLLQPVSDEFETKNGNHGLYRMDSGGRKGAGLEFLAESGKNDFNWLKTPPATPLFPSLEMETNGQELVVQREIPIIQPLSRFAGNSEGYKKTSSTLPNPNPKPKLPQRHKTPTGRPNLPSSHNKKNTKKEPTMPQKTSQQTCTNKINHTPKEIQPNFTPSENIATEPTPKPINRGVSPLVRPTITGLSNETPPNLRTTKRPTSTNRGRPTNQALSTPQKQETSTNVRRQSCSPSVIRGRKGNSDSDGNAANQSKAQLGAKQGQVLGSRMVERFMNARISNAEENRAKINMNSSLNESSKVSSGNKMVKMNGSLNESSGFGRLMSKSSLDMALKHMKIQRDSSNNRDGLTGDENLELSSFKKILEWTMKKGLQCI